MSPELSPPPPIVLLLASLLFCYIWSGQIHFQILNFFYKIHKLLLVKRMENSVYIQQRFINYLKRETEKRRKGITKTKTCRTMPGHCWDRKEENKPYQDGRGWGGKQGVKQLRLYSIFVTGRKISGNNFGFQFIGIVSMLSFLPLSE